MDEKKLGVLAAFDAATEAMLGGVYEVLRNEGFTGTQTKNIPYHFTLGMLYSHAEEERLCGLMDEATQNFRRVPFSLNHLGAFGLDVLFAAPDMNYGLLDLYTHFNKTAANGEHAWVAHATLLIDEPASVTRAFPVAAKHFQPMAATVERLELYEFFPTRLIKTVALS